MINKISKTEKIKEAFKREGKSKFLDEPQHLQSILKMNKQLEEVRREFIIRNRNSEKSAVDIILF